jgi:hypothetical protein
MAEVRRSRSAAYARHAFDVVKHKLREFGQKGVF